MIRTYLSGDLSSGFVGIRVAVSVNGKLKQKYYSFKQYTRSLAMELAVHQELNWLQKQIRYTKDRVFSRATNTGIVGLSMTYDVSRKPYGVYVARRLMYQRRCGDDFHNRSWVIQNGISDDVWFDVCNTIRNARGTTNKVFDKLMSMKPSQKHIDNTYANNPCQALQHTEMLKEA